VYFVPATALGRAMEEVARLRLDQVGPGRYAATFRPDEPGVYLVRARAGDELVSAGKVHERSSEATTGWVDRERLAQAAAITGGALLDEATTTLPPAPPGRAQPLPLAPWLLRALLLLFLVDALLRRWEHALGLRDAALRLVGRGELPLE